VYTLPEGAIRVTIQAIVTYDTSWVNVQSYLLDRLDTDNTDVHQLAVTMNQAITPDLYPKDVV